MLHVFFCINPKTQVAQEYCGIVSLFWNIPSIVCWNPGYAVHAERIYSIQKMLLHFGIFIGTGILLYYLYLRAVSVSICWKVASMLQTYWNNLISLIPHLGFVTSNYFFKSRIIDHTTENLVPSKASVRQIFFRPKCAQYTIVHKNVWYEIIKPDALPYFLIVRHRFWH